MKMLFDILLFIAVIVVAYVLDWLFTVGTFYFICKCFMWEFSLLKATGVWAILELIKGIFRGNSGSKR